MNLNKAFLIGRLTADPELRTTPTGQSVATVRLATNRVWNDKAGKRQEDTQFHNVVIWGRQAEIASQFLKKGSEACIEGRIQTRSWDDKAGVRHWMTEVVCEQIQFGARPGGYSGSGQGGGQFAESRGGRASGGEAKPATPSSSSPTPKEKEQEAPPEEIPIIDVDAEDIKPEDLPF
jgi:single-strand DNA-binding protein